MLFYNNTITKNHCTSSSASAQGGGIYIEDNASAVGDNNIVYDNHATNYPEYYGYAGFNYSCSSQSITGTGNITNDPMFVNDHNRDFNLQENSPCIDTGSPASALDQDGTIADMDALYYDQSLPVIALSEDTLFFAQTMVGENETMSFTIFNEGTADLTIYDISNSQSDIFACQWNPEDSVIVPGGSLEIDIVFSPDEVTLYNDNVVIENSDVTSEVYLEGEGILFNSVGDMALNAPLNFALMPAYPNPFNPETNLRFNIPNDGKVEIAVYNVYGSEIAKLANSYYQAGSYVVKFNADNLPGGVYFARMFAQDFQQTQKIVLVK